MKKLAALCMFLLTVSLTACYPTGKERVGGNDFMISLEELNASDSENITFHFDPEYADSSELYRVNTRFRRWDEEKLLSLFLGGDAGNYEPYWQDVSYTTFDPEKNIQKCYLLPDGKLLCFDAGVIDFLYTAESGKSGKAFSKSAYNILASEENMREYFPNEELESFPPDEALQTMNEIIKELSLPVSKEPEIYALDTTLESCQKYWDEWGVETREDQYFIVYSMKIEETPIMQFRSLLLTSNVDMSVNICALFDQEGILMFSCEGVPEKEMSFQKFSGCSGKEAAAQVKKRIESMAFSGKVKISGGALRYVPICSSQEEGAGDEEYQLKPMWVFLKEQEDISGSFMVRTLIFVDPETQAVLE